MASKGSDDQEQHVSNASRDSEFISLPTNRNKEPAVSHKKAVLEESTSSSPSRRRGWKGSSRGTLPFSPRGRGRELTNNRSTNNNNNNDTATVNPRTSSSNRNDAQHHAREAQARRNKYHGENHAQQRPQPCHSHDKKQSWKPQLRGTRITRAHILFWAGPLSNWHIGSSLNRNSKFSGSRALEFLLPRLDDAGIDHPPAWAPSTRLLARHRFNCGEQFMMACKAWLFERDTESEKKAVTLTEEEQEDVEKACKLLTDLHATNSPAPEPEKKSPPPSPASTSFDPSRLWTEFYTLLSILSTPNPNEQKALGRQTRNFSEPVWTRASMHVVVSACIVRAEIDPELRQIYHFAGTGIISPPLTSTSASTSTSTSKTDTDAGTDTKTDDAPHSGTGDTPRAAEKIRTFVEGSPVDRVWGVGLKWDDASADDEALWTGENRLGRCHDEAARHVRDMSGGLLGAVRGR